MHLNQESTSSCSRIPALIGLRDNTRIWISILLIAAVTVVAYAQNPLQIAENAESTATPSTQVPELTPEKIAARKESLTADREALNQRMGSDPTQLPPEIRDLLTQQAAALDKLISLCDRTANALKRSEELENTHRQSQEELIAFRQSGPAEKPPYTLADADQHHDAMLAEADRGKTLVSSVETAKTKLQTAKKTLDEKQRLREQIQRTIQDGGDETAKALLDIRLRNAELEQEAAGFEVQLLDLERQNAEKAVQQHETLLELLRARYEWINERAVFTRQEFDKRVAKLNDEQKTIDQKLESASKDRVKTEEVLTNLRSSEISAEAKTPERQEEEILLETRLHCFRESIEIHEMQKQRISERITAWERRNQVINEKIENRDLTSWRDETQVILKQYEDQAQIQRQKLSDARNHILTLDTKIETLGQSSSSLVQNVREQKKTLQDLISLYANNLDSIESSRRLHVKLLKEIEDRVERSFFKNSLSKIGSAVETVWYFKLFGIEDEAAFRVRNLVIALFFLSIGLMLSSRLSRILGARLLQRMPMNPMAAQTLQSLAYYAFLTLTFLLTLKLANIPLTLFAFLGGALAIGVGFGSQNIVNNFISGLILQVERPIRVGDVVDVDGTFGTVIRIGARCTQVRSFTNIDIMVPNSSFLESKVVNWTLGDNRIRTQVNVGVAYGSPTQEVARLLYKAADEHPLVLKYPEPFVIFNEFGSSSLDFELHFWIALVEKTSALMVRSDLRHRIDALCREADVVIAFPQRDVHLDTSKPLQVQISRDDAIGS